MRASASDPSGSQLWWFTPSSGCFPPAATAVEARAWQPSACQGPCGVAGDCPGSLGRRVQRRHLARQEGEGARAVGACAEGRGRRTRSPRTPRLGCGRPCYRSGYASCSFRPEPRQPPPCSPPRRRLGAHTGALASKRRRRGVHDQGSDNREPEGAAPPPRGVAVGKPEGQRHLRAGGRRFPAALGPAGRPPGRGPRRAGPASLPRDCRPTGQLHLSPNPQPMGQDKGRNRNGAPGCALATVPAPAVQRHP